MLDLSPAPSQLLRGTGWGQTGSHSRHQCTIALYSDPQWECKEVVNGETFMGWRVWGSETLCHTLCGATPLKADRSVTWVKVPYGEPLALPMAQIPGQTQEGPGGWPLGFSRIPALMSIWGMTVTLRQDPGPACNGQGLEYKEPEGCECRCQ